MCILQTESGQPYAARVDYGNGQFSDLNIPYYEQMGYTPSWHSLDPCSRTGSQVPQVLRTT